MLNEQAEIKYQFSPQIQFRPAKSRLIEKICAFQQPVKDNLSIRR